MATITRRLFAASLGFAPIAFSRSWENRAFPNWTPDYIDRVLTDSPWSKEKTVPFGLQIVAPRLASQYAQLGRAEIFLTIRWASALPVRQASALLQFGPEGLQDEKAVEVLNLSEDEYVVEIAGFPTTIIRQGARRFEAELAESARLSVPGRPVLSPSSTHVPEHGMHLIATLRFPRVRDLTAKEGDVAISAESGPLKIEQKFRLKEMMYEGRLEL